jgi:hypothetical protein
LAVLPDLSVGSTWSPLEGTLFGSGPPTLKPVEGSCAGASGGGALEGMDGVMP